MQSDSALSTAIANALTRNGARTAMRWKRYGVWQIISGETMAARVKAIAHGLGALGLNGGDVAGVIGDNCAEWVLADLGIIAAGLASAGFDAQSDAGELARLLNETQARVLFVAGDEQLYKALRVRDRCTALQTIIVMHEQWDNGADKTNTLPLIELESRGGNAVSALPGVNPDSAAFIIYTSGMGRPARGAILSQRAIGTQAVRAAAALGLNPGDERLSLTPIHHVLERVVGVYASLLSGTVINFPESRETALANLVELQPTIVQAAPQVWARLRSGIELSIAEATPFQRWACRNAFAGRGGGLLDALVLRPIRHRIGLSRARLCLSGGAPVHDDVAAWFATLGRELVDVYGHAETGGAVWIAKPGARNAALDGHTLDVDQNDEIRIRSDALFSGYAGQPGPFELSEGWWRSGDIGVRDASGSLRATGRLGDVLRLRDGRMLAPFASESALKRSPYIADAFLHTDAQDRIFAQILIDSDSIVKFAQDHSIPFTHFQSLCRSDDIRALIGVAVADANRSMSGIHIDDFTLIERALGPGDAEVGPALTLRRYKLRGDDPELAQNEPRQSDLKALQT